MSLRRTWEGIKIDPITEEVITGLIRRIRILEEKVDGKPQVQTRAPSNGQLATPGQINYLKGLGGNPWNGMTKKDATVLIGKLVEEKQSGDFVEPEEPEETGERKTSYTESDIKPEDLM